MPETPFILQEHQFHRLKNLLERLKVECAARAVFLIDQDGQTTAFHGDIGDMDTTRTVAKQVLTELRKS